MDILKVDRLFFELLRLKAAYYSRSFIETVDLTRGLQKV